MSHDEILVQLAASSRNGFEFRVECMQALAGLDGFDWCGVYLLQGDTLVLDAYVGAATDHTHIPVGRGVCGTAVATGQNQVVADVRELDNYLACSLETRSEIVVLIRRPDDPAVVLGQIDIDGHRVGRFGEPEERFLEGLAELIAARW